MDQLIRVSDLHLYVLKFCDRNRDGTSERVDSEGFTGGSHLFPQPVYVIMWRNGISMSDGSSDGTVYEHAFFC